GRGRARGTCRQGGLRDAGSPRRSPGTRRAHPRARGRGDGAHRRLHALWRGTPQPPARRRSRGTSGRVRGPPVIVLFFVACATRGEFSHYEDALRAYDEGRAALEKNAPDESVA